jgi:hypothetical protein
MKVPLLPVFIGLLFPYSCHTKTNSAVKSKVEPSLKVRLISKAKTDSDKLLDSATAVV